MACRFMLVSTAAALVILAGTAKAEIITIRSGQVGGLPGIAGQPDDTVRFLPTNPGGAPLSAVPFTPADFAGASVGPSAVVINPVGPWTPGISDPAARWIDFQVLAGGSGFGDSGSTLYAIPFTVTTPGATSAFLNIEFSVDDGAGDFVYGGPNPSFLYVNGVSMGATSTANFLAPSFHSQSIPVSTGTNTLYLYQRDQGLGVSGIIFSLTMDVVPTPGAAGLLGLAGLVTVGSRRRRS